MLQKLRLQNLRPLQGSNDLGPDYLIPEKVAKKSKLECVSRKKDFEIKGQETVDRFFHVIFQTFHSQTRKIYLNLQTYVGSKSSDLVLNLT